MSLFKVFDIASSGLTAESVRLNTTASNLANAEAVSSSINRTYRAREPVFAAMLGGEPFGDPAAVGVQVAGIVESDTPLRAEYRPDHPKADADGYIYRPNVNVVEEMANMIAASRNYQSNVEVINASKQMLLRTLTLGQ